MITTFCIINTFPSQIGIKLRIFLIKGFILVGISLVYGIYRETMYFVEYFIKSGLDYSTHI